MLDWVPVVFIVFKAAIFVVCMFLAIKWHYDQGKKKGADKRTFLSSAVKIVAAFLVALILVLSSVFMLATKLGMDLSL